MTKFYLIRHAEPDWSIADVKGLRGLQIEFCPLSKEGIKQAMCIATNPNLRNAEVVISSPYTRALQTAAIISRELRLPLWEGAGEIPRVFRGCCCLSWSCDKQPG